jgi:hypothetical protein
MPTTWRIGYRAKGRQPGADCTAKLEDAAFLGDAGVPVAVRHAVIDSSGCSDARLGALEAVDETERRLNDSIVPAGRAVDILLDLWSIVHDVDRVAAVPLEELMTTLVRRSYTTPTELVPLFASARMLLMSGTD